MFETQCPQCREMVELEDHRHGRAIRCPHCDGAFRAPTAGETEAAGRRSPPGQWGDSVAGVALVVGIAGLLASFAGLMMKRSGAELPLTIETIRWLVIAPGAVIGASWIAAGRCRRKMLIMGTRLVGYVWLLLMILLATKLI